MCFPSASTVTPRLLLLLFDVSARFYFEFPEMQGPLQLRSGQLSFLPSQPPYPHLLVTSPRFSFEEPTLPTLSPHSLGRADLTFSFLGLGTYVTQT